MSLSGNETTSLHAFSVDVEDWYQSSFDFNAPISELCVRNTRHLLDFLEPLNTKGTFFIQGLVAKQFPHLVKEIHEKGHEIQSHGFSHRPIFSMNPSEFKWELMETSKYLEDITGNKVTGFRAPDFSIDDKSFWAFEVMAECGIKYDSSIFPLKTNRYGINGFSRGYSFIKTNSGDIEELPVSILELDFAKKIRIPIGGGGYFRLFPLWFLMYSLEKLEKQKLPFIIYCHPYEFNPDEWKQISKHIPITRRFHQGFGRERFERKIAWLLQRKHFGPMSEVLEMIRGKERECV